MLMCKVCKKEFHRPPAAIRKGAKYCSRKCMAIGQPRPPGKTRVTCTCLVCGKTFTKFRYQVEHGEGKFCSRECLGRYRSEHYSGKNAANWKGGDAICKCLECGAEFTSPKHRLKDGRGKFCSKDCFYAWHKRNFRGEVTSNWRGGIAYLPYPANWNNYLKGQIRDRDYHRCMLCGKTESECKYPLSVHHIDYDKKNVEPKNLISLCGNCHGKTNHERPIWQSRFEFLMGAIYAA